MTLGSGVPEGHAGQPRTATVHARIGGRAAIPPAVAPTADVHRGTVTSAPLTDLE